MAESSTTSEKKKTNPLVFVGIGCFVLIVLIGLGSAVVGKFFASKIAGGMLGKAIESQTGVKTNIQDLEQGKMTFTDEKTGTTVNVGDDRVPDTFPKDFPMYPGAKVSSSMAGGQQENNSGFWLTLSTVDPLDKVVSFYKTAFGTGGWTVTATYASEGNQTQAVKKGNLAGTVTVARDAEASETQIVIVLSEESN